LHEMCDDGAGSGVVDASGVRSTTAVSMPAKPRPRQNFQQTHHSAPAPSLPPPPTLHMNAESYLRAQGWKGSGHSLDATGRGIKKPLLISHKQDQLGLGKKKAAYTRIRSEPAEHWHGAGEHSRPDSDQGHQSRRLVWVFCEGRGDQGHDGG
jgi:hypothetical protein